MSLHAIARTELRRLLDDPELSSSEARCRMLAFLVEETLAGRADRLKGTVLAQEVFGRGAEFDPQTDPVVRIEARRLRRDLDVYYAAHGDRARVRFAIPKGAYAVTFLGLDETEPTPQVPAEPEPEEGPNPIDIAPSGRAGGKWYGSQRGVFAAMVAVAILAVLSWSWARPVPPPETTISIPTLAVVPFVALGGSKEEEYLSYGLSDRLIYDLLRFENLRVFSLPENRTTLSEANLSALSDEYGIGYLVTGTLRMTEDGDQIRLLTQLRRTAGEVIWSGVYDQEANAHDVIALQDELSKTIAGILGQTYGIISSDVTGDMPDEAIPSDSTFACLLRAHAYRRRFDAGMRGPVLACLEKAVERDPANSDVWAMRGWLKLDQSRFPDIPDADRAAYSAAALEATSKAVELAPKNILALQAYAAVLHDRGSFDQAEQTLRTALALSPEDPETLHQLGWRLAVRGRLEEGVGYLRQAIARSIDPPTRYYNLIAVQEFIDGQYDEMLATARTSAAGGSPTGNVLLAIASTKSRNGSAEEASRALARMAELQPELARQPGAVFLRHGVTEGIVNKLVAGLMEAGWTPTTPIN